MVGAGELSEAAARRAERVLASPNFADGRFQNPVPTSMVPPGGFLPILRRQLFGKEERVPAGRLPVRTMSRADFAAPPASGLRYSWLGHSSGVLELDGESVLMDPVWAERASPSQRVGPRRLHPPPLPRDQIPDTSVVLISHDHYDHLDKALVKELGRRGARFLTSLGVGAHLERWGISPESVTELDWHESARVGALTVTATPARHFSGRGVRDRNKTLWSSWVIAGPEHRVFFTGDTGFFDAVADIGRDHGPFDLTLIKIGAYDRAWPDIHLTPEDAVRMHRLLRGERMIPIHWGTFNLAFHGWKEPPERLLAAAEEAGVEVIFPRLGEPVELGGRTDGPSGPSPAHRAEPGKRLDAWWREVP